MLDDFIPFVSLMFAFYFVYTINTTTFNVDNLYVNSRQKYHQIYLRIVFILLLFIFCIHSHRKCSGVISVFFAKISITFL